MCVLDPAEVLHRLGFDGSQFSYEDLAHNPRLTPGIWRVAHGEHVMILKVLEADRDRGVTAWDAHWTAGAEDPRHWNYWAREGLAYLHHLPDAFEAGGLVAPDCLAAARDDDEIVLLLDFVEGVPAESWEIEDYALAATRLGQAQGEFLAGQPLPSFEWLSRSFLRDYTDKPVDWSLLRDDTAWDQPLVRDNFPEGLRSAATALHAARGCLFEIAEALPRTLCHLDFWTKNLIKRPDGKIAVLDWGFIGDGAVGEDIGNLVPDAAFDHFVAAQDLPRLEDAVLEAHLQGLAEAGWRGDPRLVRLGMLTAAVKYDWLTPIMLAAAAETTHVRYGGTEEIDPAYRFRERGLALLHNATSARRALDLADQLKI